MEKPKPKLDFLNKPVDLSHISSEKKAELFEGKKSTPEPIVELKSEQTVASQNKPIAPYSKPNSILDFKNDLTNLSTEDRKSKATAQLYSAMDVKLTKIASLINTNKVTLLNNAVQFVIETHLEEIQKLIKEESKKGF